MSWGRHGLESLCDQIVEPFLSGGEPIRAAVGLADEATLPITEGIEARLRASELVVDLVRLALDCCSHRAGHCRRILVARRPMNQLRAKATAALACSAVVGK